MIDMKLINAVTFFGYSQSHENDEEFIGAYDTAKLLAESGYSQVNGGGPGVMLAGSKGAKAGGGHVKAVYFEPSHVTHFEGRMDENIKLVDESEEESNYVERTRRLLEEGDAYVVFNGGTGTISEFGMAWALSRLYFDRHKPFILYGPFWRSILDTFWKNMRVREDEYKVFRYASSPQEVLHYLEQFENMFDRYKSLSPSECVGDECELFLSPGQHRR
jgi:predicted Rossmann-fold nucleotide-binding protein